MKQIIPAFLLFGIIVSSCSKEVPPLSREEIKRKTDSLVQLRKQESDQHARVDLDHRLKIELRVMVDSILNMRMRRARGDTLKPAQSLNNRVIPANGMAAPANGRDRGAVRSGPVTVGQRQR